MSESSPSSQELVALLRNATETMKLKVDCSSASVASGGELFLRFITLASNELESQSVREKKRERDGRTKEASKGDYYKG